MARAFGPTPGRPNTRYPGSGHPPPRIPRLPVDGVPDVNPAEKLFGGQYTRAEVIQRYKRFGGPNEAIAAYKRRLGRQRKGIYLGQSSGTSSGQGSGSASGRGGTSVGSGPKVPGPRRPTFGGPDNGKPNIKRQPLPGPGETPDTGTPSDARGFRDTVIRGPIKFPPIPPDQVGTRTAQPAPPPRGSLAARRALLATRSAVAAAAGKTSPPAGNNLQVAAGQKQRQLALRQRQLQARRGL